MRQSSRRVWRWRRCGGELTTAQLATKRGIHQTMVGKWKRQATAGMVTVFPGRSAAQENGRAAEAVVEKPHAKIGQVLVERDFLAKAAAR
jgi:transposase